MAPSTVISHYQKNYLATQSSTHYYDNGPLRKCQQKLDSHTQDRIAKVISYIKLLQMSLSTWYKKEAAFNQTQTYSTAQISLSTLAE